MFSANTSQVAAGAGAVNYIEDVFSTYLYAGTASALTITNGIDLSTKGGLVWGKNRAAANEFNRLSDTVRGGSSLLFSNSTSAAQTQNNISAFNTNGFSLTDDSALNYSENSYVSWTFRKQPKFFDIVTFTSAASGNTTFSHNLGSVPGCVFIKNTQTSDPWIVYHRSTGDSQWLYLNTTAAAASDPNIFSATSTTFTIKSTFTYASQSYVAYLFAHDAGGFGLTGTDNVISCGSYTGNGVSDGPSISLGYEAQYVLIKRTDATSNWLCQDNMRGMSQTDTSLLFPNLSNAENTGSLWVSATSTGFKINTASIGFNASGGSYIYIAIRRGPMKVPTSGTSVLDVETWSGNSSGNRNISAGFPADLNFFHVRNDVNAWNATDRLRGNGRSVQFNNTNAEINVDPDFPLFNSFQNELKVTGTGAAYINETGYDQVFFNLRRAPSFFDVVCYTGTGTARTVTHNLTVAPELIIVKCRNEAGWNGAVYASGSAGTLLLDQTSAAYTSGYYAGCFTSTSSTTFGVNTIGEVNKSANTYVAYLFATCAGVSKVGSYTGNGSTQTINCGFTGGARFVLIKRTDATGDWYVYDTARGMTVLTDPYLLMNSTAAEVATLGSVTTVSTGFALNATVLAAINTNAASYIFLAIA